MRALLALLLCASQALAEDGGARTLARFPVGLGRSAQEEAQLAEMADAMGRFEAEAAEYRKDVQLIMEKKYEERRQGLSASYEKGLRGLELQERKERLEAIAQFEEFLRRYPNEAQYTPDVMFRLAELYYERTSDTYLTAMRNFEDSLRNDPENPNPPPEPKADFTPSIALYKRLLGHFPNYGLADAAQYLLGYCLEKADQFEEGRAQYQLLISRFPKSKFATEAWVRIGEYYFDAYDVGDGLDKAAQAYESATKDPTHPLYDKALYKLGWTYYRLDRYELAVARFLNLIDFYESKKKGKDGLAVGDLREEALQYTAVSFSDEKWGSLAKAVETFKKRGGRPYEGEIYRRLGAVYFDQTQHTQAIEAFRLALQKDPLAKDAPQVQQRIVQAYERDRKLDDAFRESEKLGTVYAEGGAWHEGNKQDPEVIAAAQALAEKSLYSTAVFYHQQAVVYRDEKRTDQAKVAFEAAARAYGRYLERFPRSKSAYELRYYLADTLYNSMQFEAAGKEYETVRDSSQDAKYLNDSAYAAVLSYQRALDDEVALGRVKLPKPLRSAERPANEKIEVIPLAPLEQRLVNAQDAFAKRMADDERAPGLQYKAAETFYAHNDFPEARRRFEAVVQRFPKNEVAKFATNLIVESFLISQDWRSVEETAARLSANPHVIDPRSALFKDLVKFKLAGRFKLAEELMEKAKFEEAAQKYLQLVDEEPRHEFADKALNNAAVALEKTRRFDSALKLYERIFREYPASTLADAALFRVAVNAENSYDFERAVESYQRLVKDYPASKDRESALYNAARLLEGQQRYGDAAAAFSRYAQLFPEAEDAPKNQFRAALIYEKQNDQPGAVRALEEFVRKYGSTQSQLELVVEARRRQGEAFQRMGKDKEARQAFAAAAQEFDRRQLRPDAHPLAAEAAAQARFLLAEYEFEAFDALTLSGRGKALEKSFAAKQQGLKQVNEAYQEVFKYKRLEWTLAALYRRGHALERFASTLIETPVPAEVKRLGDEAVVAYQDLLAQRTSVLEERAVESYAATLAEARKNRISNTWTKRTLESLNRFRPKEYPVLKEPKQAMALVPLYPEGLVVTLEGPVAAPSPLPPPVQAPDAAPAPAPSASGGAR